MAKGQPTPTPISYSLIRLFFRLLLSTFYGSIVVENGHYVPETGKPCIICPNHSNSVVDAPLVVISVPRKRRDFIRLTAKASLFGHPTFSSWLIQAAGTVPIQRRKDNPDGSADNTIVLKNLMEALEAGDAVCLFPEGISRFHPEVAPLKTGVARMVSDVLGRNRDDPNFEVYLLPCSVTYMHRQHFRSDVLVSFDEPMVFSVKNNPELLPPVEFTHIRQVTDDLQKRIRSGVLEAPTWEIIRGAKLAAKMYAPLGTLMPLGEYVRLSRRFSDAFTASTKANSSTADQEPVLKLCKDLNAYQDKLSRLGLNDDRIRRSRHRPTIVLRMIVRLAWSCILCLVCLPGLVLWAPVFASTSMAVRKFLMKGGPVYDTWDDISQHKILYGLVTILLVWISVVVVTWRLTHFTIILTPAFMWMSMRWMEDGVAAFRAFSSLLRLLLTGKPALRKLRDERNDLHSRVRNLAVDVLQLPEDPEKYFASIGGREKGRILGPWDQVVRYFSVRRRRKRDWTETLRLYDKVDYPVDDYPK